jgi:hypothetical protein
MAWRIRSIKPGFWESEKIAKRLPGPDGRQARLCWIGLWNLAEDLTGVARASPAFLKAMLFPYDDDVTVREVQRWLDLLERGRFIVRYEREDQAYLLNRGFTDHQKVDKPSKPTFPTPTPEEVERVLGQSSGGIATPSREPRETLESPPRGLPEPSPRPRETLALDRKGKEGRGEEGSGSRESAAAPVVPAQAFSVLEVYEHYRLTFDRHHPEPNAEQRELIVGRLREEYSVAQLKKAITGLSRSKHHRDKAYLGLQYALGDRDRVERCMAWADKPPDTGPPKDVRKGVVRAEDMDHSKNVEDAHGNIRL